MYTSSNLIEIMDAAELFAMDIRNADITKAYFVKKQELMDCVEAQALIHKFNKYKVRFDEADRFGKYYPNYDSIVKEMLQSKKEMDMHEAVMNFKKCENNLLEMLEEISRILSSAVSGGIVVPSTSPLSKVKNCNCGGSCGCS